MALNMSWRRSTGPDQQLEVLGLIFLWSCHCLGLCCTPPVPWSLLQSLGPRSELRMRRSCLLLCSLSLLRISSALVQNLQLDQGPGGARLVHPPFLSDVERAPAPLSLDLPDEPIEDHFLLDTGSYDEDPGSSLQLSGRSMRGPRRCILHQQSCLAVPKLPCCDPCDQCYCRFFNAFCYCRRVGHACLPRSP